MAADSLDDVTSADGPARLPIEVGTVNALSLRKTMRRFATGVTVVTCAHRGGVHGLTVNGFLSVSLDPPLVVVSIATASRMNDLLRGAGRYGVSVLAEDQEEISWHFARAPIRRLTPAYIWRDGLPFVQGALAHLGCRVVAEHEAGDHTLFVGEVSYLDHRDGRPLVFYMGTYHELSAGRREDNWFA